MTTKEEIGLTLIGDVELQKLFLELTPDVQNRIINGAFRSASKIILDEAKRNWNAGKKNQSKTGYKGYSSYFKSEPMKSVGNTGFGYKIGLKGDKAYKMRWLEWGTNERYTRGKKTGNKRYTGKITGTHFFYSAVGNKMEEAKNNLNDAVIKSFDTVVKRYSTVNK